MPTLAELLRLNDENQAYTGYPQMQVGLTKPRQAGYATGFLEGATGANSMQPKNPITDPNYDAYAQGKNTGELVGIGAMALPAGVALARNPQVLARAVSPLSKPQVFTESTVTTEGLPRTLANISGNPIAEGLALERYKTASSPNLQNITPRQGYWAGESNPVFVSEGNRSLTVGGNKSLLKDVAQTAENLEQAGATATRATALPFGDLSKGNAAFLTRNGKPLSNNDVTKLNKVLSESTDAVLQHRKGGEGLLFKGDWIEGVTLQDMVNIAKKEIPDLKVKPALSTPQIDRRYFERPEYKSLGALPREESVKGKLTQAFDELLKKEGYRE
jgi:hypothetical protein